MVLTKNESFTEEEIEMRKNDAGLTILEKGDVVRIGKGKVLYTVEYGETAGMIHVTSHNTGKSVAVERERLNLVESVQSVAYEAGCDVSELNLPNTEQGTTVEDADLAEEALQIEQEETAKAELTGTVLSPKDEHTSYQKTILGALNILGKHVYAGTAKNRTKRARVKLAKKARRNARKAKTARFVEISNAEQS